MLESLVSVLHFYTIPNVISQVGTLTSNTQQVVTGVFQIVVAALQIYLTPSAPTERTYDGRR
jgi:hypothetical protein